ncbi:WLM domain-containing protein [Trametes punicea]|nr:WLM domain-containing protein [Trametes punicea]
MVHVRLNEREANPNPHINFITPLKTHDPAAAEEARQLLRALAAQVRPIMKAEGFVVNSFEEYEYNKVFAGRNWNNGEVVELVLRNSAGGFLPIQWLLSTLCHELAHIKHMNHGPAFQTLWTKLRNDVKELQSKGYYGDGYWSSGSRLADSARMGSQGLDAGDLPEFMCGGAQSRARPSALRRRRRQPAGPSSSTGAQTAKRRKAGARVTAQGVFKGTGRALNEDASDQEAKKAGSGFRRRAVSKRAREERALAAERRLKAAKSKDESATDPKEESGSGEDEYFEAALETDQDRRDAMLTTLDKGELDGLRTSRQTFITEFLLPPVEPSFGSSSQPGSSHSRGGVGGKGYGMPEACDDGGATPSCDTQSLPKGGTGAERPTSLGQNLAISQARKAGKLSYGALVQTEIRERAKESFGLSSGGRCLGEGPSLSNAPQHIASAQRRELPPARSSIDTDLGRVSESMWGCQVCTLLNERQYLACAACGTPRGQSTWSGTPA